MASVKTSLTLRADTYTLAREAAEREGVSLSAYIDHATRARLRRDGAQALAAVYESDEGRELLDEATRYGRIALDRMDAPDQAGHT
jgi:phage I-like protein